MNASRVLFDYNLGYCTRLELNKSSVNNYKSQSWDPTVAIITLACRESRAFWVVSAAR